MKEIKKGSLEYWKAERKTSIFLMLLVAMFFPVVGIWHYFQFGFDSQTILLLITVGFLVPITGYVLEKDNQKIRELSEDAKI